MDSEDCEGWLVEEGIGFYDPGGQFQYGIDLGAELDLDFMEEPRAAHRTRHNTGTARTSIVLDGPRYVASKCDKCGAGSARRIFGQFGANYQCSGPSCTEKWYHSHCWSCSTGVVDSRDPATPPCKICRWHTCARCGACNEDGCSTNSYHRTNKAKDARNFSFIADDDIPFG
jgi:hypothetical protein